MRTLTIRRLEEGPAGTFGVAYDECGHFTAVTLERPWVDADENGHRDANVSRIPAGAYEAFRRVSPKRGFEVFELENVPDTSNAQIHPANTADQLEGCIAVGKRRGDVFGNGSTPGVLDSRDAFNALMSEFTDPRIRVVIHDIEVAA
jgi:hypothetical protein